MNIKMPSTSSGAEQNQNTEQSKAGISGIGETPQLPVLAAPTTSGCRGYGETIQPPQNPVTPTPEPQPELAAIQSIIQKMRDLGVTKEELLAALEQASSIDTGQSPQAAGDSLRTRKERITPVASETNVQAGLSQNLGDLTGFQNLSGLLPKNRDVPVQAALLTWEEKEPITFDRVKDMVNQAWQSAVKAVINIQSWQPFDEEPSITTINNSMDLESLKSGLLEDINKVNSLLKEAQKNPWVEMVNRQKASAIACNMLQQIVHNENFRNAVRRLAKARSENEEEFVKIAASLDLLDEFFQREYELLKEYGVPMAETLINEGRKALADVRAGNAPHTKIYESLARLGKAACGLEHNLREQTTKVNQERTKEILKKIVLSGGAVAMAITNVQAETNGTLPSPLSALSGHIAAGIIGAAATEVWSLLTDA